MRRRRGSVRRRRAPRRHPADDSRRRRTAGRPPDLPGRSLLPAAERGARARRAPSYFEAMGGDAQSRLGAAHGRAGRSRQVHRSADPRALRSRGRRGGTRQPVRPRARARSRARRRARARSTPRRPASGTPKIRRRRRACARSATSPAARRAKARYTDADDPKRLVELDRAVHDAVEAFGARRFDEAVRIYQGRDREAPGHGDRLPASRVRGVAARQSARPRSSALQRAVAARRDAAGDRRAAWRLSGRHRTRRRGDRPARAAGSRSRPPTPRR